ncbi:MAG: NADH-quinone oxidoreductase subunit J [Actinomycetota bacterium]|nr:NADH-quinone oxidoreductase subunit J [Actinomycetota bacterium]
MNAHEYAFVVVATIGSIAAVAVVTARNVVHAALYLVVTLASVGITFLLLGAEFVGWVQILIYVGAIVILFLFGLMLTKAPIGRDTLDYQNRAVGAVVAVVVALGLGSLILQAWPLSTPAAPSAPGGSDVLGSALFTTYVLPFEAVSFLLLAALIGAIVLARRDEGT